MKVIVENAIEEYADKNQVYPKIIEINEADFKTLEKNLSLKERMPCLQMNFSAKSTDH